ncbi:MAG: STAS domain-containing protein [Steroidobacteraceae bacterium]
MKARPRSKSASKPARGRPTRTTVAARGASAAHGPIVLEAECTLAGAARLRDVLCARLPQPGVVVLDATAVARVDTAALQLLAAFVRDRRLAGGPVEWRAVSEELTDAARVLGMDTMLAIS